MLYSEYMRQSRKVMKLSDMLFMHISVNSLAKST